MYQKHLTYWFIACISIVFLFSCADDGEPGPQGEKGDQGEKGEQGDQGEKGDPGTANVIYSEWLESEFENDFSYEEYAFVDIDTNQYSLNTTVFLLYSKSINGAVFPLPQILNSTTYSYYIVPDFGTGLPSRIILFRRGSPGGGSSVPFHFRYVIIPGGISASGRMGQPDFNDYEQVKEFYNIPN